MIKKIALTAAVALTATTAHAAGKIGDVCNQYRR